MKFPIVNFNKGSSKYGYPFHMAIGSHDFSVAQQLMRPKFVININAKDMDGNGVMHFLATHYGYNSEAS